MYGAMREHAPRSTRLTGAASAVALTLALGYLLATGMAVHISRVLPDPITYVALPDAPTPEPPPPTTDALDIPDDASLYARPVVLDLPVFEPETLAGNPTGSVAPGSGTGSGGGLGAGGAPPPRTPVHVRARLIPGDLPPYPATHLRKEEQGDSGLEVCINAAGRVTSASLVSSSGYPLLDEGALKWVRKARFAPSTVDGVPQAICGHPVIYEWRVTVTKLKDIR